MKKIYTFCAAMFLIGSVQAQEIEILALGGDVDISGTVVSVEGGYGTLDEDFTIKYTGESTEMLRVERIKLDILEGTEDYLCWGMDCYFQDMVSPLNPFVSPDGIELTTDETAVLFTYHITNGIAGTVSYRYYIIDNDDNRLDSIDVEYTTFLGLSKEEKKVALSVFPNPVNTQLNVVLENAENKSLNFKLYNVVGKEVLNVVLANGTNMVNTAELSEGVYFYSLLNSKDVLETKKLVITH
jgi:hypothetical protein